MRKIFVREREKSTLVDFVVVMMMMLCLVFHQRSQMFTCMWKYIYTHAFHVMYAGHILICERHDLSKSVVSGCRAYVGVVLSGRMRVALFTAQYREELTYVSRRVGALSTYSAQFAPTNFEVVNGSSRCGGITCPASSPGIA